VCAMYCPGVPSRIVFGTTQKLLRRKFIGAEGTLLCQAGESRIAISEAEPRTVSEYEIEPDAEVAVRTKLVGLHKERRRGRDERQLLRELLRSRLPVTLYRATA